MIDLDPKSASKHTQLKPKHLLNTNSSVLAQKSTSGSKFEMIGEETDTFKEGEKRLDNLLDKM